MVMLCFYFMLFKICVNVKLLCWMLVIGICTCFCFSLFNVCCRPLSAWQTCRQNKLWKTFFSDCGGQLRHIITYFPLQGTPTLYGRNNTYCGTDRCLRQSAGNGRGSALMWEQSWWEIGTLMLPAALSCHSLACPAVLAQAEVQSLNHRGRSGWPGHLICLFDHRSAPAERHCVPSLFIKIGLNGLFLCLSAHRQKQRRGRYKRPLEATDVDPLHLYLHNKFKEKSLSQSKKSSFWLELPWFDFKTECSAVLRFNSHMDMLINSTQYERRNHNCLVGFPNSMINSLFGQFSVDVLQEKIFFFCQSSITESN